MNNYDAFHSYHRIRETEGLPVIPVIVCGCASTLMIDSGSCLNLVGEQFVRDVLGIKRENISPTEIKIKGISGNTVSALGELKLNLRIIGQSFDIIFIVIPNAVFPADLLLSYWGLVYCKLVIDFGKKLIKLDETSIPFNLAHSDSGLNTASLIHSNSEHDKSSSSESVCKHECKQVSKKCKQVHETGKQDSNRSMNVDNVRKQMENAIETADMNDINSASNLELNMDPYESTISSYTENSTENELQFSLPLDDIVLNEVFHFGEIHAQELYNVMDEEFYHEDNSFNSFMSPSMNNSHKCLLKNMDESEKVSLVSVNEDASFLVKVANEVTLTPGKLTKVALMCEENTCKDLLLMNDKYKCTDVNFDNMLVKPQEGLFLCMQLLQLTNQ